MQTKIPELSLVVLVGHSGSGKSTFARKHFLPTEVLLMESEPVDPRLSGQWQKLIANKENSFNRIRKIRPGKPHESSHR